MIFPSYCSSISNLDTLMSTVLAVDLRQRMVPSHPRSSVLHHHQDCSIGGGVAASSSSSIGRAAEEDGDMIIVEGDPTSAALHRDIGQSGNRRRGGGGTAADDVAGEDGGNDEYDGRQSIKSEIERLMPSTVCGAALVGEKNSGKSSLAFQVCYTLAQRFPERQALFIHCHEDARVIAKTVRFVQQGGTAPPPSTKQQQQQQPSWDFSILENVFLKRFTTAQHLCWYFGSLHNQPDHLLPSVVVVDDLGRYTSKSPQHDSLQAYCQVLSVMRDAQRYIMKKTKEMCLMVVTMESNHVDRSILAPLCRQLGLVLRIRTEGMVQPSGGGGGGGGGGGSSRRSSMMYVMEEDRESAMMLGRGKGGGLGGGAEGSVVGGAGSNDRDSNSDSSTCHFVLENRGVLRVLPLGSPYHDLLHS